MEIINGTMSETYPIRLAYNNLRDLIFRSRRSLVTKLVKNDFHSKPFLTNLCHLSH